MRISVTHLEAFRLWSDPENEWFTEEKLVNQIRGLDPPGPPAKLGIAFHSALENDSVTVDGYSFRPEDIKRILAKDMGHPVVSEVKLETDVTIEGVTHTIVGKVDNVRGRVARETKTSEKSIEIEKWYHSAQWRFYLWMGGFDRIDYSLFHLDDDKGVWYVKNEANLSLWPYRNMEFDCLSLVLELLRWAKGKDLMRVA